nr:serine hydrolase [Aeromicrobium senzhongii]
MDRKDLPPTPEASRPRTFGPGRIRDHHGPNRGPSGLTETVTRSCSRPNLVLRSVGGPEAVEKFLRTLGDDRTQLDSYEPDLNTVTPGQAANTTTPTAFATALQAAVETKALAPRERRTLLDWMGGNSTGDTLIRASLPAGWEVADKSGGAGGMRNDIGVVTGPDGQTVYLAVFTSTNDPEAEYDDVVVEEAARAVLAEYS